jgi:hypothetical protein
MTSYPERAAFYPKIAVAYTQIATISTDDHHTLQEFRASVGAQWTFLSTPKEPFRRTSTSWSILTRSIIRCGLVIHSIYNGYWSWGRPSVIDLWHDLRAVTSEVRPEWDLRTPGLREAWNARDLSAFHGWNKKPKAVKLWRKGKQPLQVGHAVSEPCASDGAGAPQ